MKVFLNYKGRASKKFMNCISATWLSMPIPPPIYPQSQNLGNFKKLPTAIPAPKVETAADVLF